MFELFRSSTTTAALEAKAAEAAQAADRLREVRAAAALAALEAEASDDKAALKRAKSNEHASTLELQAALQRAESIQAAIRLARKRDAEAAAAEVEQARQRREQAQKIAFDQTKASHQKVAEIIAEHLAPAVQKAVVDVRAYAELTSQAEAAQLFGQVSLYIGPMLAAALSEHLIGFKRVPMDPDKCDLRTRLPSEADFIFWRQRDAARSKDAA